MPRRNRVTPEGEIVAVPERGTMYANRGVLHTPDGRIVRRGQVRRWLICELSFRGRRRPLLRPGRYTELFLLDEAVGLAAGHRPCAECRYASYQDFRRRWAQAHDLAAPPYAGGMDDVLHAERAVVEGERTTTPVPFADLPDGAFFVVDGEPHLVAGNGIRRWSHAGYGPRQPSPGGTADVLTPPSTLAVLRAGYRPRLHPTAS